MQKHFEIIENEVACIKAQIKDRDEEIQRLHRQVNALAIEKERYDEPVRICRAGLKQLLERDGALDADARAVVQILIQELSEADQSR